MRKRIVVLIALVLASTIVPVGVAVADEHGGAESNATDEWTLDELKERGETTEGGSPADRYLGDQGMVYISYKETNFIKKLGDQSAEWSVDKVVSHDKTIDTKEVTMRFNRPRDAPTETIHVRVIAWQREQRTVQEGNVTREETYATNVTQKVVEVDLEGGSDKATIRLPDTDQAQRITIIVEEYPETRWADLKHDPIALSDELPFGPSWSGFLPWFLTRFFIGSAIGVPFAIGAGVKTVQKYGSGPGKGAMWWLFVVGLGSYFGGYFALGRIAEVIVTLPWVLGLIPVLIAYVVTIEYVGEADEFLFEQVITESVTNPLGEEVPDITLEKGESVDVVDLDGTDKVGVVDSGSLKSFIALVLGAKMPKIAENDLESKVRYDGPFDGKFYVDEPDPTDPSQPDELLKIDFPTLSFSVDNLKEGQPDMPEHADVATDGGETGLAKRTLGFGEGLGTAIFAFGVAAAIGTQFTGSRSLGILAGFAPLVYMMTSVEDGDIDWVEAPAHTTSAKAQRVTEENAYNIRKTFEEITEQLARDDTELFEQAIGMTENYVEQQRKKLDRIMLGESGDEPLDDLDTDLDDELVGTNDQVRGVGDD